MAGIDIGGILDKLTRRGGTGRSGSAPDIGAYFGRLVERGKRATTQMSRGRTSPAERRHDRLPAEGVVAIEYSPERDGDPDPGEVVWAWVPFEEDPTQGKDRPVVIIGRRGDRLVGIPLTTKRNDREAQVVVGTGEWDPKRRTSHARIWRMLDLDADSIRREGAALDKDQFDAVVAAVDEYYDVARAGAPVPTDR